MSRTITELNRARIKVDLHCALSSTALTLVACGRLTEDGTIDGIEELAGSNADRLRLLMVEIDPDGVASETVRFDQSFTGIHVGADGIGEAPEVLELVTLTRNGSSSRQRAFVGGRLPHRGRLLFVPPGPPVDSAQPFLKQYPHDTWQLLLGEDGNP